MMGILNMAFFEEVVLKDSIEIKTTAEKVFNFLTNIIDDDSYRAWHKEDHVSFRWLKGNPLRVKEAHIKTGWKTTSNNYANVIIACAPCWSIGA
jgi:hypothetical protein